MSTNNNKTQYQKVNPLLKRIMFDHGFTSKQQLGLLLLLKINAIAVPPEFKDERDANDWLKDNTQKLLRIGERWSIENNVIEERLATKRELVIEAAILLGMTEEIKPDFNTLGPFQAIIPSALESRAVLRCQSLIADIKKGRQPKTVFLIVGERQLQDEEAPSLSGELRTEAKMFEGAWSTVCKENELRIPTHMVYVAKNAGESRAKTEDTARALASDHSLNRTVATVIYVGQPFATRIFLIFKTALGDMEENVILHAESANLSGTPLFIYQDELARRIFFQYPKLNARYNKVV